MMSEEILSDVCAVQYEPHFRTEQVSESDVMQFHVFTAHTCHCTNMHLIACRINLIYAMFKR